MHNLFSSGSGKAAYMYIYYCTRRESKHQRVKIIIKPNWIVYKCSLHYFFRFFVCLFVLIHTFVQRNQHNIVKQICCNFKKLFTIKSKKETKLLELQWAPESLAVSPRLWTEKLCVNLGWRGQAYTEEKALLQREAGEADVWKHAKGRKIKTPGKWEHQVHSWLLGSASRGLVLVQGLPPLSVSEVHEIPW